MRLKACNFQNKGTPYFVLSPREKGYSFKTVIQSLPDLIYNQSINFFICPVIPDLDSALMSEVSAS
jgi:hypothetical protein